MLRISLIYGSFAGLVVIAVLIAGLTVLRGESFLTTEGTKLLKNFVGR